MGALPSRRNCIASGLNERLRFERVPKQGARDGQGAVAMRVPLYSRPPQIVSPRRLRGVPPNAGSSAIAPATPTQPVLVECPLRPFLAGKRAAIRRKTL